MLVEPVIIIFQNFDFFISERICHRHLLTHQINCLIQLNRVTSVASAVWTSSSWSIDRVSFSFHSFNSRPIAERCLSSSPWWIECSRVSPLDSCRFSFSFCITMIHWEEEEWRISFFSFTPHALWSKNDSHDARVHWCCERSSFIPIVENARSRTTSTKISLIPLRFSQWIENVCSVFSMFKSKENLSSRSGQCVCTALIFMHRFYARQPIDRYLPQVKRKEKERERQTLGKHSIWFSACCISDFVSHL